MNISAVYQFDPGKAITINGRNTGFASCDPTLVLLCKTIAKDITERKLGNRLTVQVTRKKLSPAEYYCSNLKCLRTPMNESITVIRDRIYDWVYAMMNEPSNDPCIKVDFILMNEYDSIDGDVDIYYLHDGDIEDDEDDVWDDEGDDDPAEEPDMERLDILFKEACNTCKELSAAATIPPDRSKLRNIMRVIRDHDNDVMTVIQAMIEEFKIMQEHEDHLVHVIANRLNAMDRVINKLSDRVDDIEDTITETEDV